MTRHPDYWIYKVARLTHADAQNEDFSPANYQYWLNAYFGLMYGQKEINPEGPVSISINQSKKLFGLRPLWAMSFEEKRFREKRLVKTSMTSGVFDSPTMNAWAFQRELISDLDKRMILVERSMDASGSLQKLALMRSNPRTTDLQVEHRVNRRTFRIVPVPSIGSRTDLSALLSSPCSIAENVPATLL